ncbi:50S ribosomal protein L37ae [Sulfolobales archaeon HS-7]|nr:50S ribosomal protein L37ae [Sulfolobales archaeon HS-7]
MAKGSGVSKRFGARYGFTLRKKWEKVMIRRYDEHECPYCKSKGKIIRISSGIWTCKKCNNVWAGPAYTPT